ncbi:hypothetical protein BaRGS_00025844 [Batillaria attramentaria]|uniref:Uncharacterized protein n=1 Tax=Batillaria attramentaria TaxID=370345 RepID=A0ABD0K6V2_9CAEN
MIRRPSSPKHVTRTDSNCPKAGVKHGANGQPDESCRSNNWFHSRSRILRCAVNEFRNGRKPLAHVHKSGGSSCTAQFCEFMGFFSRYWYGVYSRCWSIRPEYDYSNEGADEAQTTGRKHSVGSLDQNFYPRDCCLFGEDIDQVVDVPLRQQAIRAFPVLNAIR